MSELGHRGHQCVGSGYCCVKAQCMVSLALHGRKDECPELDWNGQRHVCKLMLMPDPQGANVRRQLSAGAGCCSSLNSWRREPLRDRRRLPVISAGQGEP